MLKLVSFENDEALNVNGTSFKGYIKTDYATLVEKFGEPTFEGGLDKSTVEWNIEFLTADEFGDEDYIPATIYDWKRNCTPMGEYDWHIGGYNMYAVDMVVDALK
jgi:hypothetical protein